MHQSTPVDAFLHLPFLFRCTDPRSLSPQNCKAHMKEKTDTNWNIFALKSCGAFKLSAPFDYISNELAGSLGLFSWWTRSKARGTQRRQVHIWHYLWWKLTDKRYETPDPNHQILKNNILMGKCHLPEMMVTRWYCIYRCTLYQASPLQGWSTPVN